MPAYTPTTWVDGVTPVNAANLNKIEAELVDTDTTLGSYLPLDSVVAAATRLQANKLLVGDAQPVWRTMGDGKLEWGPGGSTAPDISLYRSTGSTLRTTGNLIVDGVSSTAAGFSSNPPVATVWPFIHQVQGEAQRRFQITDTGAISWGPGGSTAPDTSLSRSGAGALTATGSFTASGNITVKAAGASFVHNPPAVSPWILASIVQGESAHRFILDAGGGMSWGPGGSTTTDTTLYRAGAAFLKTNEKFAAKKFVTRSGEGAADSGNGFNIDWTSTAQLWIDATNVGTISLVSDKRIKKMVKPMASTWEAIKRLEPISFRWRDLGIFKDDHIRHLGFLAQEVEKVIPSGVSGPVLGSGERDPDQPLALNLSEIVAALCKALQEAQLRIEALEAA